MSTGPHGAAMLAALELRATLRAELRMGRLRRSAIGAGGHNRLPPVSVRKLRAFLGHLGGGPRLFPAAARLGRRGLHSQVGRAVLAQAASGAPARPAAHPLRGAGALHELRTGLLHRFEEGLVVGLLPTGCAPALSDVGRGGEHAPQQAAGGVEDAAHGSRRPGADPGAEAGRAPVAVEFELKALLGAQVGVVGDEFDLSVHDAPCRSRELALCLYELFTAEIAESPE